MTLSVTLLVLLAGLLHATWNALLKSRGNDPLLDTALINAITGALALLALPFVPLPAPAAWPYIAVSTAVHFAYYVALARAYRHGDLGYAYPLMRGTAPLLVTLIGIATLREVPSASMIAGILLICGGIVSIALLRGGPRMPPAALGWALANAAIIATYTLIDGAGVRAAGDALRYAVWLMLVDAVPFSLFVVWLRGAHALDYARRGWRRGVIGGLCNGLGYGIVLWAMTRAPVGAVAALRETSVLFAALIGALVLKESFGPRRLAGAALVVAGIAALKV